MHKAPIHWTAASAAKCKAGSPPGNRVSMQSSTTNVCETSSEFLRSCNVGPKTASNEPCWRRNSPVQSSSSSSSSSFPFIEAIEHSIYNKHNLLHHKHQKGTQK